MFLNPLNCHLTPSLPQPGLGNRLLLSLNLTDALLCLLCFINISCASVNYLAEGAQAAYRIFVETSGILTCYITVIRTLVVVSPMYQLRHRLIAFSILGGVVYVGVREVWLMCVLFPLHHNWAEISSSGSSCNHSDLDSKLITYHMIETILLPAEMCCIIIVSVVCSAVSIVKLSEIHRELGQNKITPTNRAATQTVLILTSLFILFNTSYFAFQATITAEVMSVVDTIITCNIDLDTLATLHHATQIGFLVIPLNSALNPLVYVLRKKCFRAYVMDMITF